MHATRGGAAHASAGTGGAKEGVVAKRKRKAQKN